jgi:hypothetical protein
MTSASRIVTALFAVMVAFVLTCSTLDAAGAPSASATPKPTPTPAPTVRALNETLDSAIKCLDQGDESDTIKLNCIMDIEAYADKLGSPAGTKAYISLARTCFKDPSYFVRLAAARTIPRIRIKRDAVAGDELKLFLDPKVIASTECLHESETMGTHLIRYMKAENFSKLRSQGMIDTIWDALLNGNPYTQKNALGEFYLVLGKGTAKELAPYKERAERFFDFLFSPGASKMDEENFITISIDQAASILFAMNDYGFLGDHLLTPIASYVLYPNEKNPRAVSPDARWGYADDLNYSLRDRMAVKLKWEPAAAKTWANALQALLIAATPVKTQRMCIDRQTAMENIVFAGHDVQVIAVSTLVELANEPSHGVQFGEIERGCGEVEARVLGSSGGLPVSPNKPGATTTTIISNGTNQ